MNNREFIDKLIQRTGLSAQDVEMLSAVLVDSMIDELASGGSITIHGVGAFELKEKGGRRIYNPSSKTYIQLQPKTTISYKMSAAFKDRLNAHE